MQDSSGLREILESLKNIIAMDSIAGAVKYVIWSLIDVCTENGIALTEMSPELASAHRGREGGG